MKRFCFILAVLLGVGINCGATVKLTFYYPVQVAGPLAILMQQLVDDFNRSHPDIYVEAVYTGNYDQCLQKAITAAMGGTPPDVAVLLAIDLFTLLDLDLITDLDQFLIAEDADFLANFYEAFLENSRANGKTWGMPFQRSTPIFYYNKQHFREAGLDPDRPPQTWEELRNIARTLTKRDARGNVVRWGFADITEDTWTMQAWILQACGIYCNESGTEAYFDTPEVKEAMRFVYELANVDQVMPRFRSYSAAAQDFVAGYVSMMINSTGSLTFVRNNATFEFGVAPLPSGKCRGVPTGGGNLYIFKNIPEENKKAAWEFVKWMTSAYNAARWSIGSGYVAVRKDAYDVDIMQKYVAEFPYILVARDQLAVAHREMMFHNNSQMRQLVLVYLHDILDGKYTVEDGLMMLQSEADKILAPFKK